jgi:hypothetical protein
MLYAKSDICGKPAITCGELGNICGNSCGKLGV